ncbi:DUF5688 family protein [Anaerocolumna xylanovorans]|uniref:Uncharacterized protein n=1 Tax=Anaerocolumna xylanovorans DSM 12503 TaxID=1121345 RepID=A0A1M7YMH3_9FIRM|nr:DUF5688 family protein [Anaerocolumna xylanovorans]SHO53726.1 hypothetical protein SAMN02745217_04262 [Anaerocolumna xylanovorans DSM 12503]
MQDKFYKIIDKNYGEIKENIFYRIINYEKNKRTLSQIPYLPFLDLAVTFYYMIQNSSEYISSIPITNRHLKRWKVNLKTVMEQAVENTPRIFPVKINSMEEEIRALTTEAAFQEGHSMYVISNTIGINGASCLLYKEPIKLLAEKLNGNFYILPSSIHEIIAIKDTGLFEKEELARMVKEVNMTQVAEEDYLSDSIYYYCKEEKRITVA